MWRVDWVYLSNSTSPKKFITVILYVSLTSISLITLLRGTPIPYSIRSTNSKHSGEPTPIKLGAPTPITKEDKCTKYYSIYNGIKNMYTSCNMQSLNPKHIYIKKPLQLHPLQHSLYVHLITLTISSIHTIKIQH